MRMVSTRMKRPSQVKIFKRKINMSKPTSNCTIYIVRHGQTYYNARGVMQGHIDSPLTKKGVLQAEELATTFKDIPFDAVFSSDLYRAKRTAEIVVLDRQLLVNTSPLLRERSYGSFEGKKALVFQNVCKEALEKIAPLSKIEKRKYKVAHDVESNEEICNRLILFLSEMAATHGGKNVLVVSHGGIMRSFINYLEWLGDNELPAGGIENTGYIKVLSDGINFTIDEVRGLKVL